MRRLPQTSSEGRSAPTEVTQSRHQTGYDHALSSPSRVSAGQRDARVKERSILLATENVTVTGSAFRRRTANGKLDVEIRCSSVPGSCRTLTDRSSLEFVSHFVLCAARFVIIKLAVNYVGTMGRQRAFTLVELVMVVLILGFLAAVAVPKLLSVNAEARDTGLRQSLATVREGIDLWKTENGRYPASTPDYEDFIQTRLRAKMFPSCPVGKGVANGVAVVTDGTPLAGTGGTGGVGQPMWKYDSTTGEMIINYHALSHDGSHYDEW